MVKNPQPYVMPLSAGGTPVSGEIDIDANGVYDVAEYATAKVNVPQPTGTLNIEANGDYNVAAYASVHVAVSLSPILNPIYPINVTVTTT